VTNLVVTPILRSVDTLSFRVDPSASTSTTGHSVAADRDLHFVLIPIAFVLPGSPSGTDPTDPCPTRGCMAVYQAHSDDDKLLGKQFFRFGTQRSPRIFACSTRGKRAGKMLALRGSCAVPATICLCRRELMVTLGSAGRERGLWRRTGGGTLRKSVGSAPMVVVQAKQCIFRKRTHTSATATAVQGGLRTYEAESAHG
jgi:hypothetical protein